MKEEKKKWWEKFPKEGWIAIIIAICMIIIVVSMIVIEFQKDNGDLATLWQSVVVGILCSVVASVIFVILQNCFSREENKVLSKQLDVIEQSLKRQNDLYDSGIESIHPKSYFDKEEEFWKDIINDTKNRLDLIGHSLSNWFKNEYRDLFVDKIQKMLNAEKDVRVLLSANEFNYEKVKKVYWEEENLWKLNKTERTVLFFLQLLENVASTKKQYLKLYVTERAKVTYLYIRTDIQCIVSPYIHSPNNNQNSFLLELKSDTAYTRAFENDFMEMIEGMENLDVLSIDRKSRVNMELIQWKKVDNKYSGSNWDFEKTEKYVFKEGNSLFEVGYFEHYNQGVFVKSVIELPVSYGCPSKCKFCASSAISEFQPLEVEQMLFLFEQIYFSKHLEEKPITLLTMTGTGDLFFNEEKLKEFLLKLKNYDNLYITLSSCLWNNEFLCRIDKMSEEIKFRNIQITYVSSKKDIVHNLIPFYLKHYFDFDEIVEYINSSTKNYYRINYIMIKGCNDKEEDFCEFKDKIAGIKDKIVVRISKLNETKATMRNNLEAGRIEDMKKLEKILQKEKIRAYLFYSEENDNMNCGQLITEKE